MIKKLAIFGFAIVWIVAIAAIIFVMLPKLTNSDSATSSNTQNKDQSVNRNTKIDSESGDSFFYDKKVFVRHKKNDDDTNFTEKENIIITRKNLFFKPPPIIEKTVEKPIVKPTPKKKINSDFDIKEVPSN